MFGVAGIDKESVKAQAQAIMDQIAEAGVPRVLEAGQPPGQEAPLFAAVGELEKEGKLKTRMTVSCFVQRPQQAAEIHWKGARSGRAPSMVMTIFR